MYFQNYGFQKTWLDQSLKIPVSEDPTKRNMVNATKHCWNLKDSTFTILIDQCQGNWQHLYHFNWSMSRQMSLLVICKILRRFSNTLSAYGKYSLLNTDNLMQPIQMQLSWKENLFSAFFSAFSKSRLNFEHFQKKRWSS